ncbi:MAG TPA: choice-of-anchor D domain-containing protein [Acidobacteriaceae bacterium]|nr:choice-of-anchor D domain-containing protein [Acidobacteriaceae bacterium]
MISGEINRADGLADIVVAVNTAAGARALVFESPRGALQDQPEIFALPRAATALALGRFDGGAMFDLAIGAGNQLVMIHARDRKLSLDEAQRAAVPAAKVTVQNVSFAIKALTGGDFTDGGASVAALGADGVVHILQHAITSTALGRVLTDPDFQPTFQFSKPDKNGDRSNVAGRMTPNVAAQLAAMRQSFNARASSAEWTERGKVALPAGFGQSTPRLVAGRLTGSLREDILAADSSNAKVHVLSTARAGGSQLSDNASASERAVAATPGPMRLLGSLESLSAPAAVLPMRLNQHGLNGLVMLHAGQTEPTIMPHDTPPANTFTVTNTSDSVIAVGTSYTGPAGSLRKAMYDASQATGTSSIVFNIPTTDPGYNPTTGSFLIQPLSESVPGAFNNFALGPINATVTIDGYTQPGASPNTSANADNAKLLIQIDGAKATTPGGAGLVPFDDSGSVYRGLIFTGWTLGQISNNTESGAEGMEANGVADYIEGNFFGVDATGKTAAPNRIGVFADNGPGLGSTAAGNIIGGTTPQARNLLSGNTLAGVLFLSTAIEAELQGNWIGLDVTGTTVLPNGSDGTGLNGQTVTIGGTLPGDANVISGNPTNVDINDITEGHSAKNSSVQGNLIGTDPTGTIDVSGGRDVGVSIIAGPSNMLIGGTAPAARNIISGNNYGVYIYDGSFNNTVQGNYIGTDITGTKAVGNTTAGFSTGVDTDPLVMIGLNISAGDTTLGGSIAGAGNVISGNGGDGVQIAGASNGPNGQNSLQGNTIQGNLIGTDATGKNAIGNLGNGIYLSNGAANNIIGGTQPGAGNIISNNAMNGVLIDPGTAGGGTGNNTVANTIWSNTLAGIKINTGSSNRISQNSIFENGALGIALGIGGPNINTSCNSSNSGPNKLQNAPSLTAGSGATFVTATATDPSGNTSQFSNSVAVTLNGNMLSLLGSFNSTANTTYNIEFFSSTAADPSGFGQGETYLGSATVTTNASCTVPINTPEDTTQADMGVTLTTPGNQILIGPDYGSNVYTGTVTNHGVATAHNIVFTDTLPAGLSVSSMYCNVGPCQTPITSSLGACTVSGQVVTCNLGAMASGATATISIPVEATGAGSLVSTAMVSATEVDPNLANNTATSTGTSIYPPPFADALSPASALVNSSSFPLIVYGEDFVHQTAISFDGTSLPTTAVYDNQPCTDDGQPAICTGIQVQVPASLLTTARTVTVEASSPDPTYGGEDNFPTDLKFVIQPSCVYSVDGDSSGSTTAFFSPVESDGTTLIPEFVDVGTNVQSCTWTATSTVPWAVVLEAYNNDANFNPINASGTGGPIKGSGEISIAFAPNTGSASRSGSITIGTETVNFTQEGGATCDFPLTPSSAAGAAVGGAGSFKVTTGTNCTYFVESEADWITIPQASGLLTGTASPNYSYAANVGPPRTGAVLVGGEVFTVNQAAPTCYYTLSTTAASLPVTGGTGSIGVTPSSPSCAWTAKSSNTAALSVTSGASGTGNGTVNYSVPANAGGPQTVTITVGDTTGYTVFTETQASAYTCSFSLSPAVVSVPSNGTSNFILINASFHMCKWTANSSDPTALSIKQNPSGMGTAAIYYAVAQNTSTSPRVLTIVAGCETFTVNQDGAAAANPVPALTSLAPSGTTAGTGAFTLTVNGSNFITTSSVNFNGVPRPTTYVNATQLTASIPATDVASAGTPVVTVTNPSPGGGTSNPLTFTIAASTNPTPQATLNPTTIPFASTAVGSTITAPAATLTNGGSAALTISSIAITGTGAADFAQTNTCGGSLAAGASCSITVSFKPLSAASFTAAVSVTDNATGSPQAITLTGTGTAAAAPAVSLTPPALTFSAQTGTTAAAQVATLKNTGNAALTISNIGITGANPSDFAQTNSCGSSLAAGASCNISVTFTPASVATFAASLSVTDNATGSPHAVALTGTGTAAPAPAASLAPTSLTFSAQTGTTATAQVSTLKNTGDAALTITGISITGAGAADFAETNTCGSSLAAGAMCSISVTFTPASAASFSAAVSIADNATGSPQTLALSGTGTAPPAPIASVTPTSLTFTAQTGNSATAQTTTLKNTGNAVMNISGITLTGAGAADFAETNTCSATLAAGATCAISVTFTPASVASFSATISIADDAAGSPQAVTLSGTGTAPPVPTYTVSSSTPAQTIQAGGTAQYSITVTAQNGTYSNPVTFSASGLPSGATATFTPSSVTPGSSSATSQLSIQTAAPVTPAGFGSGWRLAASTLSLVGLFFAARRFRRRWVTLAILLFASLGAVATLSGCGGGFGLKTGTNYTVTINANSGETQQSTTVQLTVQ